MKRAIALSIALSSIAYVTGCSKAPEADTAEAQAAPVVESTEAPVPADKLREGMKPAHDHDHAGHDHDHAGHDHAAHADLPPAPPALAAAAGDNPHAAADHFIVSVGDAKLSHAQLDTIVQQMAGAQLSQFPPQFRQQIMQQMMPRIQQQAIDRFIAGELLAAEAARLKIEASPEEIENTVAELKKQIPESVKWEDALKQMGTSDVQIREDMARDLMIQGLIEAKTAELPKPDATAVRAAYDAAPDRYVRPETASARHILLQLDENATAEAKAEKLKKIQTLRQQIIDGGDFAALAKANSDCPSKEKGGDLGSFGRTDMVKPFADAAFEQELNKVGEVVETQFGYHLIEVSERSEAGKVPFEEVEADIAEELSRTAENDVVTALIDELRGKATITYGEGHAPQQAPQATP